MRLPQKATVTIAELREFDPTFDSLEADEEEISNAVGNRLSERFGFCHFGFVIDKIDFAKGKVYVSGIKWDTSE